MNGSISRRGFLQVAGAVAVGGSLSRPVSGVSPNGKLRTAHIGVGGMGRADLDSVAPTIILCLKNFAPKMYLVN